MEIRARDDRKIVEIWLANGEQQDDAVQDKLKRIYQQCKEKNYLAAVFLSGKRDLIEETGALLRRGKRRSAELEVQRERKGRGSIAR